MPDLPAPVLRSIGAGIAYFMVAFAAGFLLGVVRVLLLAPGIGELAAVALELPVILALSWFASRWLVSRFHVKRNLAPRLAMGMTAFGLLMLAEVALSMLVFDRAFADHLQLYSTVPAMLGLAGQIAFAAIPAIQLTTGRRQGA